MLKIFFDSSNFFKVYKNDTCEALDKNFPGLVCGEGDGSCNAFGEDSQKVYKSTLCNPSGTLSGIYLRN